MQPFTYSGAEDSVEVVGRKKLTPILCLLKCTITICDIENITAQMHGIVVINITGVSIT